MSCPVCGSQIVTGYSWKCLTCGASGVFVVKDGKMQPQRPGVVPKPIKVWAFSGKEGR
jgi:hypothetical protein